MRLLIAVLLSFAILGGLWLYTHGRSPAPAAPAARPPEVIDERFTAEVTLTFSAEPDPFALTVDDDQKPAALLVRFNGNDLLRVTDALTAGEPIILDPLPGVVIGRNEFFLEANPPAAVGNQAHAARVRVLRGRAPFAEDTYWSEPGGRLTARFTFSIDKQPAETGPPAHDHP